MKAILIQYRTVLIVLVITFLSSAPAVCEGIRPFTVKLNNSEGVAIFTNASDISGDLWSVLAERQTQEPGDSLTKAEIRQLRREARTERRAQERIERNASRRVVDNPRHADYILLGEDLPRGRNILDALSGRVPGMMISEGRVVVHGPNSFNSGGVPLFLVDEMQVSDSYVNSISIEEIDRVEIFTGPAAAMYGSRVGTAVISIFTKHSTSLTTPVQE